MNNFRSGPRFALQSQYENQIKYSIWLFEAVPIRGTGRALFCNPGDNGCEG